MITRRGGNLEAEIKHHWVSAEFGHYETQSTDAGSRSQSGVTHKQSAADPDTSLNRSLGLGVVIDLGIISPCQSVMISAWQILGARVTREQMEASDGLRQQLERSEV